MNARKTRVWELLLNIIAPVFMLMFLLQPVCAYQLVEVDPVNTPHGAVILIVDGLSSSYIYPEFTPHALDGSVLEKANAPNISLILNEGCRILDVRAPRTYTEAGHSVLITGYSDALSDSVAGSGTTIYDVVHEYDYLAFGIMEKGDFASICAKQDVILHDISSSINKPEMIIDTNIRTAGSKQISLDVADIMQNNIQTLHSDMSGYSEGSQERYDIYNRWAIETAIQVIDLMQARYPEQPYLLTINVGAVDCAGHYKKDSGYISTIEGLDPACLSLYRECSDSGLAFFFTADHGMAFASIDTKGGHQSDKYSWTDEAQRIPLVVSAPDVERGLIPGEFGQEDIAPTILEVLDLPGELVLSDGEAIELKDHASIRVLAPDKGKLIMEKDNAIISEVSSSELCLFRGLETGHDYTISLVSENDNVKSLEKKLSLRKSETIDIRPSIDSPKNDISLKDPRFLTGSVLIGIINITGFAFIRRILKE